MERCSLQVDTHITSIPPSRPFSSSPAPPTTPPHPTHPHRRTLRRPSTGRATAANREPSLKQCPGPRRARRRDNTHGRVVKLTAVCRRRRVMAQGVCCQLDSRAGGAARGASSVSRVQGGPHRFMLPMPSASTTAGHRVNTDPPPHPFAPTFSRRR